MFPLYLRTRISAHTKRKDRQASMSLAYELALDGPTASFDGAQNLRRIDAISSSVSDFVHQLFLTTELPESHLTAISSCFSCNGPNGSLVAIAQQHTGPDCLYRVEAIYVPDAGEPSPCVQMRAMSDSLVVRGSFIADMSRITISTGTLLSMNRAFAIMDGAKVCGKHAISDGFPLHDNDCCAKALRMMESEAQRLQTATISRGPNDRRNPVTGVKLCLEFSRNIGGVEEIACVVTFDRRPSLAAPFDVEHIRKTKVFDEKNILYKLMCPDREDLFWAEWDSIAVTRYIKGLDTNSKITDEMQNMVHDVLALSQSIGFRRTTMELDIWNMVCRWILMFKVDKMVILRLANKHKKPNSRCILDIIPDDVFKTILRMVNRDLQQMTVSSETDMIIYT